MYSNDNTINNHYYVCVGVVALQVVLLQCGWSDCSMGGLVVAWVVMEHWYVTWRTLACTNRSQWWLQYATRHSVRGDRRRSAATSGLTRPRGQYVSDLMSVLLCVSFTLSLLYTDTHTMSSADIVLRFFFIISRCKNTFCPNRPQLH